ncbi:hypothetical protein HWV07_12975 [Natronomonas salina]|uniref:CARDB domain-containing protein n=1 Tax=Natronomonas salina TaxID=1710540 RepID=UPI0015B4DECF|nr:CARDB domain-containing protein [Natronomonas salina]QLD89889.1 hypothetical protein HWV07_12975 [Natronomonas salina]
MRSVAALSLVTVVLLGGVVTGAVITDDAGEVALPSDAGPGDDAPASHGDADRQPSATTAGGDASDTASDDESASTGQQGGSMAQGSYSEAPNEDYQSNNDTNNTTDNDTGSGGGQNDTNQSSPTPGPADTPTPTPQPTDSPQPTETEADDDDDDGGWFFDSPTPEPTDTPTPTPQPTDTPSAATFEVVDALGSDSVTVGEYVEVTAMVENRGDQAGTYETELQVDGDPVATEEVFVEGGDVQTVTYQVQFENPGEYDVSVNNADAGTVEVTPRETDPQGGVEVIDAVVPADMVESGVETTARATVENPTDQQLEATLNVTIDGEQVAQTEVTLGPGERTEVSIPFEAQSGTVAVNGVEAGELRVDDSVGNDEAESAGPNEESGMDLGFLILGAAIIVACAILVAGAVRWQSDDSMLSKFDERRR